MVTAKHRLHKVLVALFALLDSVPSLLTLDHPSLSSGHAHLPFYLSFCSLAGPLLFNMGENWFQRELMVPRRLAFNVLFYGLHVGIFAYGWYSQVLSSLALMVSGR